MIKSMTGYGKAEAVLPAGKLTIEIRTLNGKSAEVSIKSQVLPKDKEMIFRQRLSETLVRGTIDCFVSWEPNAAETAKPINAELLKAYYDQIRSIRNGLPGFTGGSMETTDRMNNELLTAILRFPDIMDNRKTEVVDDAAWPAVSAALEEALAAVNAFRDREGAALYKDVTSRVAKMLAFEDEVESFDPERIAAVRERLDKALAELGAKPDKERFEQELIFYLEKYDINEEKVRLRQHCKYFMDTIDGEPYPGKKLGFIIQEMGREINTTGSKANHALIQQTVVRMKDELEKIREQSMNIL